MRVAWSIGRSTTCLMDAASETKGINGVPDGGIAFESPSSVASDEYEMFMKSSRPLPASRWAMSALSCRLSPPIWASSPIIRIPTRMSEPIASRIDSSTSTVNRNRFSIDPPYSSVLRFAKGVQNWSMRWLVAHSSMPSSPPARARTAAAPKSATTRRMSDFSISFGQPRCIGSRIGDGAMRGSQSPSCETLRRPMWVIWHITAVPWR